MVKPISDSYEKQRQFITNAGHDLKTPITVIDADTELAELELGQCEWLDDIRKQTRRLARLTGDLIYLSRMDEQPLLERAEIDFSALICEEADSFSAVAVSRQKDVVTKIAEGVSVFGNATELRKLVDLLIDNAVKYSTEEVIGVTLERVGKHARLAVTNAAEGMTDEVASRMFDRFYRGDGARSSHGGFGIGLSIASAIVAAHKGRIAAATSGGMLTITVMLPIQ